MFVLYFYGRRQGAAPLDFHTWYSTYIVDGGLMVLFFGLFRYFSVFFSITICHLVMNLVLVAVSINNATE